MLTRRWNEGCRKAAQLWRDLLTLVFRGRQSTVRHWVGKRRPAVGRDRLTAVPLPPAWPVPRGYRMARLLMSDPSTLKAEDNLLRTRLLEDEPALGTAVAWALRLNELLRRRVTGDLGEILTAADNTLLARFASLGLPFPRSRLLKMDRQPVRRTAPPSLKRRRNRCGAKGNGGNSQIVRPTGCLSDHGESQSARGLLRSDRD